MTINGLIKELPWNKRMELLRVAKNLSQREMAEKSGTTQKVYWDWENGNREPSEINKRIICRVLRVNREEIFGNKQK